MGMAQPVKQEGKIREQKKAICSGRGVGLNKIMGVVSLFPEKRQVMLEPR